jgi:hypothetical protein
MVTARRVAWGLAGWGFGLLGVALVLRSTHRPISHSSVDPRLMFVLTIAGVLAISVVGAFVASRQPRNAIGWAFLIAGVSFGYTAFAQEYVARAVVLSPGSLPLASWVAVVSESLPFVSIWIPILLIPYVFPTGKVVSRRWLPGLAIGIFAIVVINLGNVFERYVATDFVRHLQNPLSWPAFERLLTPVGNVLWLLPFVSLIIGAVSLVVRFRRSHGVERQQLKWIAVSGIFVLAGSAAVLVTAALRIPFLQHTQIPGALIVIGMGSMPLTVGIAITRYRLYDVDRLIRRTVSYLIVTALLASFYAVIVVTPAVAFRAREIPNVLVALGTLAAATAFVPVRRRVQHGVDRRFNRSRFDAAQTIDRFVSRLRLEVDLDQMGAELAGIVRETMQPASVGLWLRTPQART